MYLLVTVILNLVVLVLSTILLADFRAWKRGGTGGTPPTILGYLKLLRWGLYLAFHPEDLLDASGLPNTGPSYLRADLITKRYGHPPVLTKWILPQREKRGLIDSAQPFAIGKKLGSILFELWSSPLYNSKTSIAPSKTEGGSSSAIYVNADAPNINPDAKKIFYEVAHVHPKDGSLHVYLAPRDAKTVIERGWGMRFPVSWIAPPSWTMVLSPRTEEEVDVVREIVRAGVEFAVRGGEEVAGREE